MSIQLTPEEMRRLLCDEIEKPPKPPEKPLTAYQREKLAIERERLELSRDKAKPPETHHTAPQSETSSNIKTAIAVFIATVPLLITLIAAVILLLKIS